MMRHLPPVHAIVGYTLGLIWGNNTPEQFLEWTDQEFLEGLPDACEELGVPVPDMGLVAQEFEIQGEAFRERARLEIAEAERRAIEQLEDRLDYEHFVRTHWYP